MKDRISIALFLLSFFLSPGFGQQEDYRWQRVLEGGGGATCKIWFHPAVPDEMIISGDVGGPWRWNRATGRWDYLADFSPLLEDHCNAQIVYDLTDSTANTFLMHNSGFGTIGNGRYNHFYLTRDGGKSFQPGNFNITGKTANLRMDLMTGDPYNKEIIYLAGINGIEISFDQGMSFERLENQPLHTLSTKYWDKEFNTGSEMVWVDGTAGQVTDILNGRSATHARRLIVTQITPPADEKFSYITQDGGKNWAQLPYTFKRIRQGSKTGLMLASGTNNFFTSLDGENWTNTNSPVSGGVCDINPFNNAQMVVSGYMKDVALSLDTGKTWTSIKSRSKLTSESPFYATPDLYAGVQDIAFDPHFKNRLWVGNWFFWAYTDSCLVDENINSSILWQTRLRGYEEMSACGIGGVSAPGGEALAHFTYADNGGIRITDIERFPETRDVQTGTKGNHVGIDYCGSDNDFMVCTSMDHWWDPGWGFYSTNNGKTWTKFKTNPKEDIFDDGKLYNSTGNIAVSAGKTHGGWPAIVRGNVNPYYSHDGGYSWTRSVCDGYYVIWSNLSKTDNVLISDKITPDKFYYLGFTKGYWDKKNLYVSTDGGKNFPLVKAKLPNATKIAVNPWVDGDLWIGENGTNLMHSRDGGYTWVTVGGITQTEAFGLGKGNKPDSVSVYVLGMYNGKRGVYRSDDQGASWLKISDSTQGFGMMEYRIIGDAKTHGRMFMAMTSTGAFFAEPTNLLCTAPTNARAVGRPGTVQLSWEGSSGIKTFHIYRSTSPEGPFILLDSAAGYSYTDKQVENEQEYFYTIKAIGYKNSTEAVGPVSATPSANYPPSAVRGLLVVLRYDNIIARNALKVSWSRNPMEELLSSYVLMRKSEEEEFAQIATLAASSNSYTDTSLINGKTYTYMVFAENQNGSGNPSDQASAKYFDYTGWNESKGPSQSSRFRVTQDYLIFEEPRTFSLIDMQGVNCGMYHNCQKLHTGRLSAGIYLLRYVDGTAEKFIKLKNQNN